MKPLRCLLFFLLFLPLITFAQTPQGINYQAIARYQGAVLTNQIIDLRITIFEGPNAVYQELHNVLTSQYGLFTIEIGSGIVSLGSFTNIDWSTGDEFMKVEIDANSGGFVSLGTKPFWSVPYALHAQTSGKALDMEADDLSDVDTAGLSIGDYLQWDGTNWVPAGGTNLTYTGGAGISISGSVITNTGDIDSSDDITIGSAAGGDLTGLYPNPTVARIRNIPVLNTSPSANDILKFNNGAWAPGQDNVNDPDSDPNNEIQTLGLSGGQITLSNGGGSVTLPTYIGGLGIDITGPVISNTGDTNPSDDITIGSAAGGDLTGTYPNPSVVKIHGRTIANSAPNNGYVYKWDQTNAQWLAQPDDDTDADANPTNELQTLSLTGNTLSLSMGGGSVSIPVYTGGPGIIVTGNTIINTGDLNASDDITTSTSAGGDLSGIYPNPTVSSLQGSPIASISPSIGQILKWSGSQWVPGIDEGTQSLSLSGNILSLSGGGGSVNLPSTSYTAGTGISISGNIITNTGDTDPSDDITITSIAGGDVSGTFPNLTVIGLQGNLVSNIPPANGEVLTWNGTQWAPGNASNPWAISGSNISYSTGNVGINTTTPSSELEVNGTSTVVDGSGNLRVEAGSDANGGFVNVYNSSNVLKAGLRIDGLGQGEVFGDVKNFRIDHPTSPNHEIWYASLEGPEAAAYVRGTATLVNGKVEIEFDDHFQLVSNPETMTVILTPLSAKSKGLAVIEKTGEGFTVQELFEGEGNYSFDWEVKCVRRGHENFEVIRKKQ